MRASDLRLIVEVTLKSFDLELLEFGPKVEFESQCDERKTIKSIYSVSAANQFDS